MPNLQTTFEYGPAVNGPGGMEQIMMVNTPNAGHQHPGHPGLVHHQPHPQPYSLPNNQSAYGVATSQYSTAQGGYSASVAPQYTVQGGQPSYSTGPTYASPPQAQHSTYMLPHHHYDANAILAEHTRNYISDWSIVDANQAYKYWIMKYPNY